MKQVIIVGGGLAGTSAAVALQSAGYRVILLESRPRLGGRAGAFVDQKTGETIDSCQHVSMGCCTNLQHFCDLIGCRQLFSVEPSLLFIDPDGRRSSLQASRLPAPLHLFPSFLKAKYLTLREKWQLAFVLRKLARWRPEPRPEHRTTQSSTTPHHSFLQWLHESGQSQRIIERFWEVILVSALSESLDRIDIGQARKVLVDGFLGHRDGWQVHVPQVSLDEIFGSSLQRWLESHGINVRLNTSVRRLHTETSLTPVDASKNSALSVELRTGEQLQADDVILAVPQHRLLDLLPESMQQLPSLRGVSSIESAPITSVHLWFDNEVIPERQVALMGRLCQWVFRRPEFAAGWSHEPASTENTSTFSVGPQTEVKYQVVISASRGLAEWTHDEVLQRVLTELHSIWPDVTRDHLRHWRIVTDHRAVFSATPGVDQLRPKQELTIPHVHLAGDWTATGWPATMEGAVRSGFLAAESVCRQHGSPQSFLQRDLPVPRFSRWLFGNS